MAGGHPPLSPPLGCPAGAGHMPLDRDHRVSRRRRFRVRARSVKWALPLRRGGRPRTASPAALTGSSPWGVGRGLSLEAGKHYSQTDTRGGQASEPPAGRQRDRRWAQETEQLGADTPTRRPSARGGHFPRQRAGPRTLPLTLLAGLRVLDVRDGLGAQGPDRDPQLWGGRMGGRHVTLQNEPLSPGEQRLSRVSVQCRARPPPVWAMRL